MIKKINLLCEKKALILFNFFLILQPFLDLLTSFLIHNNITTNGVFVLKVIFLLFALYYIIFVKKKDFKYISLIFIYSVISILVNMLIKKQIYFIEFETLIKVIYFPIILTFVLTLFKDNEFNIKYLFIPLIIYILLIFIPNIFNLGYDSYLYDKVGSVGFFFSANAVGSIISIIAPVFIFYLLKNKKMISLIVFTLIYLYVLLSLGTKAPILTCLFILVYFILYLVLKLLKQKKYKSMAIIVIIAILFMAALIYILPSTAFYKNLIIHANNKGISKLSDLLSFKNLDEYIFSSRLSSLIDTFKIFVNSLFIQKLFGIGYIVNNVRIKTSEMDYFVLLMHNGIIGFTIIYLKYFKSLYFIFKNYIKKIKVNFFDLEKSGLMIAIIISIVSALLVGHVLDVPSVSIFVATIIGMAKGKKIT